MTNHDAPRTSKQRLWMRALTMLLMALILQLCGTLLFVLTIVQFLLVLITDAPNARLIIFSRSLGRYVLQIVWFLTFASEEEPFPFSDWPSGE